MIRSFKEKRLAREEAFCADIKYTYKYWKNGASETGHRSDVVYLNRKSKTAKNLTHVLWRLDLVS